MTRRGERLRDPRPCPHAAVIYAKGIVQAQGFGQPDGAIVVSNSRLTNDEARRISKLISRLPELVELERDRNKARSRRNPQPRCGARNSNTYHPIWARARYKGR